MKRLVYLVFAILLVGLAIQIYKIDKERRSLTREMKKVNEEFRTFDSENATLSEKIGYLSNVHNLEKELRSRFNYRLPNEKLIIIVPKKENASSQ